MRLAHHQAAAIVQLARQLTGVPVDVRVFGSRLHDRAKGGDLDLLIELPEPEINPALFAARLSAKVSRLMDSPQSGCPLVRPQPHVPAHSRSRTQGQSKIMAPADGIRLRLQFLVHVVRKECGHLAHTDQRLFELPSSVERVKQLNFDPETAKRVEAFVGRFGRLKDTLGDKLLPLLLTALGKTPAAMIDNLDKAERLTLINSADDWLAMRKLRNQMVHKYIEDSEILASALQSGHEFVATLVATANRMLGEIETRGWK